jgi:hypothetical protein
VTVHVLTHLSAQERDAIIVLGYSSRLAGYIQTFDIPVDAQADGNWMKD